LFIEEQNIMDEPRFTVNSTPNPPGDRAAAVVSAALEAAPAGRIAELLAAPAPEPTVVERLVADFDAGRIGKAEFDAAAAHLSRTATADEVIRELDPLSDRRFVAAVAIACGTPIRKVAKMVSHHERTIRSWLAEDEFKAHVLRLRREAAVVAVGRLTEAMSAAANRLIELIGHEDGHVAFKASAKVLDLGLSYTCG
jgi:hypothetical protein